MATFLRSWASQFNGFANTLLASEEQHKSFNVYETTILSLYEACKT